MTFICEKICRLGDNEEDDAKIKVYFYNSENLIFLDIIFIQINRTQELPLPLIVFGLKEFDEEIFKTNVDELLFNNLAYSCGVVYKINNNNNPNFKKNVTLKFCRNL